MDKIRGFERISFQQWEKDSHMLINYLKTRYTLLLNPEKKRVSWVSVTGSFEGISLPKRATARSAGYDIYSPFEFELNPGEEIKLPTGIKVYMKEDEVLLVFPRSGLGFKYYTRLANTVGVIDSDYYNNSGNEGHIFIKLRNEGSEKMKICSGEGVAQAIFQKFLLADDDDTVTAREGGLGSTG